MKAIRQERRLYYRVTVIASALVILALSLTSIDLKSDQPWMVVGLIGFIAFLANFPLQIFLTSLTLVSVITLGCGLIYGVPTGVWIAFVGIFIGSVINQIIKIVANDNGKRKLDFWYDLSFEVGLNVVALAIAFSVLGTSYSTVYDLAPENVLRLAAVPAIIFPLVHSLIFWVDGLLLWGPAVMFDRQDLFLLIILQLMTIPLVLLGVATYPILGSRVLMGIGVFLAIIAILLQGIATTRSNLQKRVRELSTLGRVSQALRASLDLGDLLPVIQEQVMDILGVDNFYVALMDHERRELWYPLAVKFGERQEWPPRPIEDRLTDRVIRDGKAIMFTPQIQSGPNPVGVPPGEAMPLSWLGVPLVTPELTIGCLAVFELREGIEFSPFEVDLLTIVSGQVSIAIENALLYAQTQSRASQLETLNQLTRQITATLDLDEVVAQVCQSVALVGGSQRSAIYLYNPGEQHVRLAYAHGMSAEFIGRNQEFSIGRGHRTRCLRTGKMVLTPDVPNTSLPLELLFSIRPDGIQAYADFPLVTPEGQIGFLSVFYDAPHQFSQEEVELLETFAGQAALAVANARLHARTDEQLARRVHQLAILESVGRQLSKETHSGQLFTLILDYALDFTQAPLGLLALYFPETGGVEIKAENGMPEAYGMYLDSGITFRAIQEKRIENVGDVSADPDYIKIGDVDTRSQLSVPIIHEDRVLGVITLESDELDGFSVGEQSLVDQLANQAAVAIVNADLHRDTRRHLQEQSTLYQVAARFMETLITQNAIDILYQALDAVAAYCTFGIYLWDEDRSSYLLQPCQTTVEILDSPLELQENVLDLDLTEGQSFLQISPQDVDARYKTEDVILAYPIVFAQKVLGLVIAACAGDFDLAGEERNLLEGIIAQGTIALQNTLLFSESVQRREQLTAVINSVAESIVMLNREGWIKLSNQPVYNLTGLTRDLMQDVHLLDLSDEVLARLGFQRPELEKILKDLARGDEPSSPKEIYQVPESFPLNVGERMIVVERMVYAVRESIEHAMGWMIVWRDVTEEYQLNQEREAIADSLIHDLRSPMSAVLGSLDLLATSIPEDADLEVVERSLRVARRGAKRVLRLIMSLLDVARMQSGRIELDKKPVDLAELIPELLDDIELIADEYRIRVESEIPKTLPIVFVDEDKISRVLVNLLDNAVKFSVEDSWIRVVISLYGDDVLVQVWDQGPGVSEEYRAIIFERFSQISGQFGRWRGAGLGLAFCRLAVEAHGGRIWVDDPPDGQGSIFSFTLPV